MMGLKISELRVRDLSLSWSDLFLYSEVTLPLLMPIRLATDLDTILRHVGSHLRCLHWLDTFRKFRQFLVDFRCLHTVKA